jgi:MYXO-CTERM domain-containing protein
MRLRHILLATSALLCSAAPALADLPPPDGTKFVGYGFQVDNLAAFPDYVVLAFPWSMSSGRPSEEHAVVSDGKRLGVGRRSASPKLYAMKRADYEAWKATYTPPQDNYEDPQLRTLFASDKVRVCDQAPEPKFSLDEDDERNEVVQAFRALKIDGATCALELASAKDTSAKTEQPSNDTSPSPSTDGAPKSGGCAGCTVEPPAGSAWALIGSAVAAALLVGRRRRD